MTYYRNTYLCSPLKVYPYHLEPLKCHFLEVIIRLIRSDNNQICWLRSDKAEYPGIIINNFSKNNLFGSGYINQCKFWTSQDFPNISKLLSSITRAPQNTVDHYWQLSYKNVSTYRELNLLTSFLYSRISFKNQSNSLAHPFNWNHFTLGCNESSIPIFLGESSLDTYIHIMIKREGMKLRRWIRPKV